MTMLEDRGTATAAGPATMPGWHIAADLTPPELLVLRRMRVVRAFVLGLVVAVVGAAAGGYLWARAEAGLAAADVAGERATTAMLLDQQREFTAVTSMNSAIATITDRIAGLMGSDVDVDVLLGEIWAALPAGMALTEVGATVPPLADTGSGRAGAAGAAVLDTSTETHIGTLTLSGTGTDIADLPRFIAALAAIDGVFDPFPTANQTVEGGTEFTLQLTLTDRLLTHRFETEAGGP